MAVREESQPSGKPKNEPGSEKNRRESSKGDREATKPGRETPKTIRTAKSRPGREKRRQGVLPPRHPVLAGFRPGSQDRQLRSRSSICQASEASDGSSSCPRKWPTRADNGRSSSASLKISRATSETLLPWIAARFRSAARSLSATRSVNIVFMKSRPVRTTARQNPTHDDFTFHPREKHSPGANTQSQSPALVSLEVPDITALGLGELLNSSHNPLARAAIQALRVLEGTLSPADLIAQTSPKRRRRASA